MCDVQAPPRIAEPTLPVRTGEKLKAITPMHDWHRQIFVLRMPKPIEHGWVRRIEVDHGLCAGRGARQVKPGEAKAGIQAVGLAL